MFVSGINQFTMAETLKGLIPEKIKNLIPETFLYRTLTAGAVLLGTRWLIQKLSDLR